MANVLIGSLGMILILLAFILDEFFKSFNQDTVFYNLTNSVGSSLLIYYSLQLRAWPFVILNIVWFITAAFKLSKITVSQSRYPLTASKVRRMKRKK
jgi:hypothetical protein